MENFFDEIHGILKDEFSDFLMCCDMPPYRGLRLNKLKCSFEALRDNIGFPLKPTPFCSDGFYIPEGIGSLGNHPLHCAGAFYIQEPSAMSAVSLLSVQKGDFVLDLCAAPGGKSTQIAAQLDSTGLVWSNEIIAGRANILLSNIERMGVKNAVVSSCHPQVLCERLPGFFDKILVDAPCSGEGMFRKDETIIPEWTKENVRACANRQLQILESAKLALKSGGVIVYSTCTFSEEENEGVIQKFLSLNPDFELEDGGGDFGRPTMTYAKRIFPMDGGEGHFAARLRHKGGSVPNGSELKTQFKPAPDMALKMYKEIFPTEPFGNMIAEINGKILALPNGLPDISRLGVLRAGVLLGEMCKNRVEPAHSAFMAAKPSDCANVIELDCGREEILKFLHGEEIEAGSDLKGYCAVSVCSVNTGFGKASGGRLKNKYPKGLRTANVQRGFKEGINGKFG